MNANRRNRVLNGKDFLCKDLQTNFHQTTAVVISKDNSKIIALCESGVTKSLIKFYDLKTGELISTIDVGKTCISLAISGDDRVVAAHVYDDDSIVFYCVATHVLITTIRGSNGKGFMGKLRFPSNSSSSLIEYRVSETFRNCPRKAFLRYWDIGSNSSNEEISIKFDIGDDDIENLISMDEFNSYMNIGNNEAVPHLISQKSVDYRKAESSKTETNLEIRSLLSFLCDGKLDISRSMTLNLLKMQDKHEIHKETASEVQRNRKTNISMVLSKNGKYAAVGHYDRCSVIDIATGSGVTVGEVCYLPRSSGYPMVPLGFVNEDKWLVSRCNHTRTLFINDWARCHFSEVLSTSASTAHASLLVLKDVGGTISDDCCMSPDGRFLVSWPFRCIEVYAVHDMVARLQRTERLKLRINCLLIRRHLARRARTKRLVYWDDELLHVSPARMQMQMRMRNRREEMVYWDDELLGQCFRLAPACVFQHILSFV